MILRRISIVIFGFALFVNQSLSQSSDISWYSFGIGYSHSNSPNNAVKSILGQVFIDTSRSAGAKVSSGFLSDTLVPGFLVTVRDEAPGKTPREFALYENYPNPFNPATTIRYDLPRRSHVRIDIYNALGQEVATLIDGFQEAGYRSIAWQSTNAAAGVYFYRIRSDGFSQVKKMILLK